MIGILYPSTRAVAYSSLFYRLIRNRLMEDKAYSGSWFLEDKSVVSDRRGGLGRARLVLVSLPYELMYRDFVETLLRLGVEPSSRARLDDTVIVAGGPAVTANPAPVLEFVDAVMIGEIEDVYDMILDAASSTGGKSSILSKLAEIPGMLVPGRSSLPVRRHYVKDLDSHILSLSQETPGDAEPVWGESYILETSRGCGRGCRFCMEGFIFRPKRDRSASTIRMLIDEAKRRGYPRVSFYSLSFFDNPAADGALEYAISEGLEASVPSLRADTLNSRRLELIGRAGQKTLTIAPETGSCRMCNAINKRIPPSTVLSIAEEAPEHGIKSLKLYLITGFPGETEEDFSESLALVERAAGALRRRGLWLKVSLNPFIPKPATALQWAPAPEPRLIRKRQEALRKLARRAGNVQVSTYDPKWAVIQTVVSRGGKELSRLILEWAAAGPGSGHFRRAARIAGIDVSRYLGEMREEVPVWHKLVEHPYANVRLLRREYRIFISSALGS